jgi:NAD(P)-dependent dehydrogenase (short-subunit alcohol dehydrogenase family)
MNPPTRTALVTGATGTLGHEIADRLAGDGAHVVVHARTRDEGEDAIDQLVKDGADPLRLDLAVADFARLTEVVALGHELTARYPQLDLLVNNAALAADARRTVTEDGHELTFQVNYLAHYALTRLLWPALTAAGPARVVNVSSTLHRVGHLHWGDVALSARYTPVAAYAQSKLALTMFTKALASRGNDAVTAVSTHPGLVASPLMRAIYGPVGGPAADAAHAVLRLAEPQTEIASGDYYEALRRAPAARLVHDRRAVERLWRLSARMVGMG